MLKLPLYPSASCRAVAARSSPTNRPSSRVPLSDLENLADALLDFQGPADLNTWLNSPTAEPTSGAIHLALASLSRMLQRPHLTASPFRPHRFAKLGHGWDLRSDRAREPGGTLPAPGLPPAAWPGPAAPLVLQRISLPGHRPYTAARTWWVNFTKTGQIQGPTYLWRTSCWPVSLATAPRWPSCPRPNRFSAG